MAKCRRWPAIPAAGALRRTLLDAVSCGCRRRRRSIHRRHPPLPSNPKPRSDRLSELLKAEISDSSCSGESESDSDAERKRKVDAFEALQAAVKGLQQECGERRREAAAEVRRLAKGDADARKTLAMLGAIPPLVGIIGPGGGDLEAQISALYALLNLGIGNDPNKAAIVKAGAVHKMLALLRSRTDASISEAIVANFLGLSALDANKPVIGSSPGAVPFLVKTFQYPPSPQSRQDSLRAIFNLSLCLANVPRLVGSGLVSSLIATIGDMDLTDRALAVLANIVCVGEGRCAVVGITDGLPMLIDVLNWLDSPLCQEKAAYILMVMAHKSNIDRKTMISLGIKSALLELVLVGSTLAQKRASRILEILRVDKGKGASGGGVGLPVVSAPLFGEAAEARGEEVGMSEERRAVKELVNESLHSNLQRIAERANGGQPGRVRGGPAGGGSSKSLPF